MNYEEIGSFELTEPVAKRWAYNGMVLLAVSLLFFLFTPLMTGKGLSWYFHWYTLPLNLIFTAVLFVLHELIHGLVINLAGAKARYSYGIKAGVPYLATTTESLLTLPHYRMVALAPVLLITLAGVAVLVFFSQSTLSISLPLAIHTSGAIGDLSILKIINRYPKESVIKDELTGFRVFKTIES